MIKSNANSNNWISFQESLSSTRKRFSSFYEKKNRRKVLQPYKLYVDFQGNCKWEHVSENKTEPSNTYTHTHTHTHARTHARARAHTHTQA